MRRKVFFLTIAALALVTGVMIVSLAVLGSGSRKGDKPSTDWSRGLPLGQDSAGPVSLVVEEDGRRVHMTWPIRTGEDDRRLRYVQLDGAGNPTVTADINLPGQVRTPYLLPAAPGEIHLFWAGRLPGEADWSVWHDFLGKDGEPSGRAARITPAGAKVGKYAVATDRAGGAVLAWDRGSQGDLSVFRIDRRGQVISSPVIITSQGERPSLRVDPAGVVHLTWLSDRRFYYTTSEVDSLGEGQETEVVDLNLWGTLNATGDTLEGPVLGYAGGWVYLFWSILSNSDTEAGSAVTEYAAFPAGEPTSLKPQRVWAIPGEDQPYAPYDASFSLTQLSRPLTIYEAAAEYGQESQHYSEMFGDWADVEGAVSDFMVSPAAMIGDRDELALALAISQDYRLDSELQIATAVFSQGQYRGYSLAGRTANISDNPVIAVDGMGNLYLAWREGARGKAIYYTTTVPAARIQLDKLTVEDWAYLVLQGGLDALVSIMLMPVAGWWIVPGLAVLYLWKRFSRRARITEPVAWIPFAVALLLFFSVKLLTLPTITTYVPFSAWLQVPDNLSVPFQLAIPVLILLLAVVVANKLRVRFANPSAVFFYLALALTDTALTLAVYGVNWIGAF